MNKIKTTNHMGGIKKTIEELGSTKDFFDTLIKQKVNDFFMDCFEECYNEYKKFLGE